MSILQELLQSLQNRHRDLKTWLQSSPASERQLRFGPARQSETLSQIPALDSALERAQENTLGRCKVCHETVDDHLLQMDFESCVCLEHLSPEERGRLESELELAVKVQRAILPHALPSVKGWELAAYSQPASIVGGDYFDFVKFGDSAQGFLIADVMGKGMPASMLMANLQASMRIIIPESNSPLQVVERVNRLFRHNITLTKFVSLFIGHLDPESGILTYVNAGHNPPFVVSSTADNQDSFVELQPTGPAIGLVEEATFETRKVSIGKGSSLVLFTDGFVEGHAASGEEFGTERLRKTVVRLSGKSVQELATGIQRELQNFTGRSSLQDDATLIILQRSRSIQ